MTVKLNSLLPGMPHMSATMSSRDHPFNRSTRPLLGERKPQLLIKKKLSIEQTSKVHGFNDFQDIVSQGYHSKNTHIGYPYGSPPSPSVINSSDFVFSDDPVYTTSTPNRIYESTPTTNNFSTNYNHFSNGNNKTKVSKYCDLKWRTSSGQQHHPNQPLRIPQASPVDYTNPDTTGPFIFGVHTADTFIDNHRTIATTGMVKKYRESPENGITPTILDQSNSDTSSSSQTTGKDRRLLVKDRKDSTKRIRKDKKLNKNNPPSIKCVLVGDGAVGKTNLIVSYLENRFLNEHIPTASDIYNAEVMVNDSPVHVTLCDTAGQDTLDQLRELCYPDSDVFLLCFSIVKPETFRSIKIKWAPKFCKTKASLVLVGTQSDLRNDSHTLNKLQMEGEKPISFSDAWDLATSIGAKYIETSSFTQDKIKDVFDTAIWEALAPTHLPPTPPFWKRMCCLA